MKKEINDPHKEIASQYGLPYMTEDLAHLVESVIVELLNTRGVEANVNI